MHNAQDYDDKYPIDSSWYPWRSLGLGECRPCHSWAPPSEIYVSVTNWYQSWIWGPHQGGLG